MALESLTLSSDVLQSIVVLRAVKDEEVMLSFAPSSERSDPPKGEFRGLEGSQVSGSGSGGVAGGTERLHHFPLHFRPSILLWYVQPDKALGKPAVLNLP